MWGEGETMVPLGQHMANLRRRSGLGKDPVRAAERAKQPAAIDPDWNCPWPLDWQRHYRVFADLADADGHLPEIAPGVLMDGDDIGRWLQGQAKCWGQLSEEQQRRLSALGVKPAARPAVAPTAKAAAAGAIKASMAFQRGVQALTQYVAREGADKPISRGHVERIAMDGVSLVP